MKAATGLRCTVDFWIYHNAAVKFWIGVLCVFLVGCYLSGWPEGLALSPWRWLNEVLKRSSHEIGMAFIVAPIIAIIVDRAAKKELLTEFAEDISSHIIGRLLPVNLREYISEIMQSAFVRTRLDLEYDVKILPDRTDFLKVQTRIEYELENKSDTPRDYCFKYEVEKSFYPEVGEAKIIDCSGECQINPKNPHFHYPDPNDTSRNLQSNDDSIWIEETVSLIPPGKCSRYLFMMRSEECIRLGSLLPFFASWPIVRTSLTIYYDPAQLRVALDAPFAKPVGEKRNYMDKVPLAGGERWTFTRPMLPGHGLNVRISKNGSAAKRPADATET